MPAKTKTRTPRTHEQTINTSLAEILSGLGRTWTIHAEDIGGIFEEGGRPDILIEFDLHHISHRLPEHTRSGGHHVGNASEFI